MLKHTKIQNIDEELTTKASHKFHKTNPILNTFSFNMCCINGTLGLLNSSVETKGLVNNLKQDKQLEMKQKKILSYISERRIK